MNMEVKETWIQEEGEFMLRTDCSLNNKVSLFISWVLFVVLVLGGILSHSQPWDHLTTKQFTKQNIWYYAVSYKTSFGIEDL